MDELKLIEEILKLMKNGDKNKLHEIAAVIGLAEDEKKAENPSEESAETEDDMSQADASEIDKDFPISNVIQNAHLFAERSGVEAAIPIVTLPTIYGNCLLIPELNAVIKECGDGAEISLDTLNGMLECIGLMSIPVTTVDIMYEELSPCLGSFYTEAVKYMPSYKATDSMMLLIIPKQEIYEDFGYIFPMDQKAMIMIGAIATSVTDMLAAVKSLKDIYHLDLFKLPEKAFKVLKKGRCKNGCTYDEGVLYSVGGEIIPHKNGIHYAGNVDVCKTWYKNAYKENTLCIVQIVGKSVETSRKGVFVTDSLISVGTIDWEDAESVYLRYRDEDYDLEDVD